MTEEEAEKESRPPEDVGGGGGGGGEGGKGEGKGGEGGKGEGGKGEGGEGGKGEGGKGEGGKGKGGEGGKGEARPAAGKNTAHSSGAWKKLPVKLDPFWTKAALIGLVVLVLYYRPRGTRRAFVYDDEKTIVQNADVKPWESNWFSVWRNDYWGTPIALPQSHKSYRPLTVLSFRLDNWLAGKAEQTNAILHAAVSILSYRFCWLVSSAMFAGGKPVAKGDNQLCDFLGFVAGLMFAVHPIHVEAVGNVTGRAEIMAALFWLVAACVYLSEHPYHEKEDKSQDYSLPSLATALLAAFASFLCKETGATSFLVLMLYEMLLMLCLLSRRPSRTPLESLYPSLRMFGARTVLIVSSGILAITSRYYTTNGTMPVYLRSQNPTAHFRDKSACIIGYFQLFLVNLKMLLYPCDLCHAHSIANVPIKDFSYLSPKGTLALVAAIGALLASLCFLAIDAFYSSPSTRAGSFSRVMILSAATFVVNYIPASNLVSPVGFHIAERALYLPSLGFVLLITTTLCLLAKRSPKLRSRGVWGAVVVFLFLTQSLKTYQRVHEWSSMDLLSRSGLLVNPSNPDIWCSLATQLKDSGATSLRIGAKSVAARILDESLEYFDRSLQIDDFHTRSLVNKGAAIEVRTPGSEHATTLYERALGFAHACTDHLGCIGRDGVFETWYNLGNSYLKRGVLDRAVNAYSNAIVSSKGFFAPRMTLGQLHNNLGVVYKRKKDFQSAIKEFETALMYSPNNANAACNIGNTLFEKNGNVATRKSVEAWRQALKINPKHENALNMLDKHGGGG